MICAALLAVFADRDLPFQGCVAVRGGGLPIRPDSHFTVEHFWLSDNVAVAIYKDKTETLRVRRLDARTGKLAKLPGIGPNLDGQKNFRHGYAPDGISPDGKWFIGVRDTRDWDYEAIGLANGHVRVWHSNVISSGLTWLPDSRRWFYWDPDSSPPRMVVYSFGSSKPEYWPIRGLPAKGSSKAGVLGMDASKRVYWTVGNDVPQKKSVVKVYRFNPKKGATAEYLGLWRNSSADPVMTDSTTGSCELSPRGDQLAFVYNDFDENTPGLHRYRVLVSRLDGSGMRLLGTTPKTHWTWGLIDIQWKPDGKALSFFYHDKLWTLPLTAR